MKSLKHIRVAVCLVMLVECVLWVLAGLSAPSHTRMAASLQLSPTMAAVGVGSVLGAGLLWLSVTFLLGRVYCSSVCPLGTLQDFAIRARSLFGGKGKVRFVYHKGNNRRFLMLGIYVASFVATIGCVPLLLEPWASFVNALGHVAGMGGHPVLKGLGVGASLGLACAAVSVLLVLVYALMAGRDFCNEICPVGTVLRLAGARAVMHIELYPDRCTSCLKCQDACKASCIDIKSRTVDNGRCVRCFNCVAVCDDDAIRFTVDRTGVASPLFQKRRSVTP